MADNEAPIHWRLWFLLGELWFLVAELLGGVFS
jgi:hypothetical protein